MSKQILPLMMTGHVPSLRLVGGEARASSSVQPSWGWSVAAAATDHVTAADGAIVEAHRATEETTAAAVCAEQAAAASAATAGAIGSAKP